MLVIALSEKGHRLFHALRCPDQSIACRIFIETPQYFRVELLRRELLQLMRWSLQRHIRPGYRQLVDRLHCRTHMGIRTSPLSHYEPSPAYSKKLFSVSSMRMRSSFPAGKPLASNR